MHTKSIMKGVAAGVALGGLVYMVSQSSPNRRRSLKRSTGQALRAFGNVVDNVSAMMR